MIRSIKCCSDCHYQNSKQIRFSADSQDSSAEDGNITSCTYTTPDHFILSQLLS